MSVVEDRALRAFQLHMRRAASYYRRYLRGSHHEEACEWSVEELHRHILVDIRYPIVHNLGVVEIDGVTYKQLPLQMGGLTNGLATDQLTH